MKAEVAQALDQAARMRQHVLSDLSYSDRVRLLEALFEDAFVAQRGLLVKWSALTGQSAQVDTGYIAQHVASIVLATPGQGFKGKGLDLIDGSEVKSAASLSGVDRPRWNHNLGTMSDDLKRRAAGVLTRSDTYLQAPHLFYLLFDRVEDGLSGGELVLRVRAWLVDARRDTAWRDLVGTWMAGRSPSRYNMQLHPPVGYDDDIVVNSLGNLDMEQVKLFEVRMTGVGATETFKLVWSEPLPESVVPVRGRCVARPYGGRGDRPSRIASAEDVQADLTGLAVLVPGLDTESLLAATRITTTVEETLRDDEL
ncbi:MamI family restriction endonuclease [Geodermatophilus sp. CPCC 206100]|uniref:MamI family restriction endonuclease n=1 Tax=Geodermatophilus sp. CPCC 206100 TaxID=3020054 RepID=UPI003AFFBD41